VAYPSSAHLTVTLNCLQRCGKHGRLTAKYVNGRSLVATIYPFDQNCHGRDDTVSQHAPLGRTYTQALLRRRAGQG